MQGRFSLGGGHRAKVRAKHLRAEPRCSKLVALSLFASGQVWVAISRCKTSTQEACHMSTNTRFDKSRLPSPAREPKGPESARRTRSIIPRWHGPKKEGFTSLWWAWHLLERSGPC